MLELHYPGRLAQRQLAVDAMCLFVVAQARRGAMKPVNVRGAVHHLQTKPEPYVTFYPDPRLFLWVQVYYCYSNSFNEMSSFSLQEDIVPPKLSGLPTGQLA